MVDQFTQTFIRELLINSYFMGGITQYRNDNTVHVAISKGKDKKSFQYLRGANIPLLSRSLPSHSGIIHTSSPLPPILASRRFLG